MRSWWPVCASCVTCGLPNMHSKFKSEMQRTWNHKRKYALQRLGAQTRGTRAILKSLWPKKPAVNMIPGRASQGLLPISDHLVLADHCTAQLLNKGTAWSENSYALAPQPESSLSSNVPLFSLPKRFCMFCATHI